LQNGFHNKVALQIQKKPVRERQKAFFPAIAEYSETLGSSQRWALAMASLEFESNHRRALEHFH
jgi:hypothetical protein